MATYKEAMRKRGTIKGRLTSFSSYLASYNPEHGVEQLRARLEKVEESWDSYQEIQEALENVDADDAEKMTQHNAERKQFEESYYQCVAAARRFMRAADERPTNGRQQNPDTGSFVSPHFKLPPLNLPTFDGNYENWISFSDSFKGAIDQYPGMIATHKLQYLRSCLTGKAADIIRSLEITEANYDVAWNLLKESFENRRMIVQKHVRLLCELPAMTRESAVELHALYNNAQAHIRVLKGLGQSTNEWGALLLHIITSKFDRNTLREWGKRITGSEVPTLDSLWKFLKEQCQMLDAIGDDPTRADKAWSKQTQVSKSASHAKAQHAYVLSTDGNNRNCPGCGQQHNLQSCEKFRSMTLTQKTDLVKKSGLCFNCLRQGHRVAACKSSHCKKCEHKHHTLMHADESVKKQAEENSNTQSCEQIVPEERGTTSLQTTVPSHVLLSTALVYVINDKGIQHVCRVLLDSGSQSNFMTAEFAKATGNKQTTLKVPVSGFGDSLTYTSKALTADVKSRVNEHRMKLSFLITERIVDMLPTKPVDTKLLKIPKNLLLADPNFHKPSGIDALLGAEVFYQLLCVGQIALATSAVLQKTKLGWIVAGDVSDKKTRVSAVTCNLATHALNDQVKRFWELEEPPSSKYMSSEEHACEEHFVKNVRRTPEGRYMVRLPFNEKKSQLGDSYNVASKRLCSLEKRFSHNESLKKEYTKFLNEYEELNHMKKVSDQLINDGYYMPHQAVVKKDSLTTKLRVVFDASAQTHTGVSLNEALMVGATIQPSLFAILIKFRTYRIALIADIKQMYRQVLVHEDDAKFQKILWRSNPSEPMQTYELKTLTYGTASASHLAIRALFQLADDEGAEFPEAARVIRENMYVDDVFTGASSVSKAKELQAQLTSLFSKGKFELKKWASNSKEVLEPLSRCDEPHLSLDTANSLKALGIYWKPQEDQLTYVVKKEQTRRVTKRTMLSELASLYDPLGLAGPVIAAAKILLQELWKMKLEWDESVPANIATAWNNFRKDLPSLEGINIERNVLYHDYKSVQLHGFSDASDDAYGACIYLVCENSQGVRMANLIASRSRVAPLKKQTIPKLELCGALLLADLMLSTKEALNLSIDNVYLWTDSKIALQWIKSEPYRLELFVANRVAAIQRITENAEWRHVKGCDNPADLISRGCKPREILNNQKWFHGPPWLLHEENQWPVSPITLDDLVVGIKKSTVLCARTPSNYDSILERYSSFTKLRRIVAYALKFIYNTKEQIKKRKDTLGASENTLNKCSKGKVETSSKVNFILTASDIKNANVRILSLIQAEAFPEELKLLKERRGVSRASKLLQLAPFLAEDGLMRVGGRLRHANLNFNQKHQVILPRNHFVTNLIIKFEHVTHLHAAPKATLHAIRRCYWPIGGERYINKIVNACVKCFRFNTNTPQYLMSDLPKCRFESTRPFVNVGVDFCGPFFVKEKRERNRGKDKVYVALFICLACKAIHLEVVGDLTSDSFIEALKRFCARRGKPKMILSDNATNFIGAKRELREIYDVLKLNSENSQVLRFVANEEISWNFIPPRSPHFGGIWERAVRSFKHHFRRIIGDTLFTYEQFGTIVTEIEGILNSRPITAVPRNANDILSLSPCHFLIGECAKTVPERDLTEIASNRLSAWQHVQQVKQKFWARWREEYLHELTQRTKWYNKKSETFKIGQVVILKEDNVPCLHWPLGKIVEIHPSADGVVRVVTVKTSSGMYKRCVKKIAILPIDDNFNDSKN